MDDVKILTRCARPGSPGSSGAGPGPVTTAPGVIVGMLPSASSSVSEGHPRQRLRA